MNADTENVHKYQYWQLCYCKTNYFPANDIASASICYIRIKAFVELKLSMATGKYSDNYYLLFKRIKTQSTAAINFPYP